VFFNGFFEAKPLPPVAAQCSG